MTLVQILIATVFISLIAFTCAFTLVLKKELLNNILPGLVALSTGALTGGAFLHRLPFAAGNFIYIATELIPEIKHQVSLRRAPVHFLSSRQELLLCRP